MKKAAIMCRVSSDEQAKGYSLDDQLERLQRYCEKENIEIVYTFKEDHSAKSFNRPAWKEWMEYVRRNHRDLDLLLFTTWDRFARDIAGAYTVLDELTKKYKIQPQAVEQKIDFSVPETKAMLALYLAMPEIDNDRRSIKIKGGIRQAYKQGRYIRVAPYGYKNTRDQENKPIIIPHEINAPLIQYAFDAYANGMSQVEILHILKSKGLRISKSNFCEILTRVVYIGKIVVPANEEEPMQIVEGVHTGLVTEELFYKVQYLLSDKSKIKRGTKFNLRNPEFPMRGHLTCSKCDAILTGSGSKGRLGTIYFYYHCNSCKKERYRANLVHSVFDNVLKSFTPTVDANKLYELMVKQLLVSNGKTYTTNNSNAKVKMSKLKERLENLQDLLVDGTVSSSDYKKMRVRYESELYELKQKNTSIIRIPTIFVILKLKNTNTIQQIKQGNEKPLFDLYKLYRDEFVVWTTQQFGATKEQAKDAFQDAILDFHQNIISGKLIEFTSSEKTYIFQIGKHKILNILKKESRITYQDNLQLIKGKEFEDFMENDNTVFTQEQISDAINKLSKDCQEVLKLHYFKEYDMDSIARELNYKNADTAKSKKSVCMKRLIKELSKLKMLFII